MKKISFLCVLLSWILITSYGYAADDLCPQDSASAKTVPGDVAGVQADIDRLNLCVERARLLKQLDDIAKQRSDTLNKIKDPVGSSLMGGSMAGGMGGGLSGIAPLPLNALPDLPRVKASSLQPGETRINKASGDPMGGGLDELSVPEKKEEPKKASWKIRKIWGQAGGVSGATMQAQLSDGNGNLLNVAKGDPLPDGNVVDSVSIKGVTLSQKGKIDALSWDEQSESPNSGSTAAAPAPAAPNKTTP